MSWRTQASTGLSPVTQTIVMVPFGGGSGNCQLVSMRSIASLWWLWWRLSARRVVHSPLQLVIVIISIAIATTLWSAVIRVSLASVDSFERNLGLDDDGFQVLISPVGGRFSLHEISPCLSAISPYGDLLAVRREPGSIQVGSRRQAVSVVGVGMVAPTRGDALDVKGHVYVADDLLLVLGVREGEAIAVRVQDHLIEGDARRFDRAHRSLTSARVVLPLRQILGDSLIDTIAIRRAGVNAPDLVRDLTPWIRSCIGDAHVVRVETSEAPLARGAQLLAAYRSNILIMAMITLVVCCLLLSQATHLAMRSVLRQLSIIRTLGVSRVTCFSMIVFEMALLSCVGTLCGYSAGYPAIVWLTGFLLNTASDIYHVNLGTGSVVAGWLQGVGVAIGMVGVGACSAAVGARAVLKLPPYRGTRREQVHNSPMRVSLVWWMAAMSAVTSGVLLYVLRRSESVVLAYVAIAAVVVCAACVTPVLLLYAGRAIPCARRVIACWLARRAIASAGSHFVLSAIAASIAVALMTGLSVMVFSFRETLESWSRVRLAGDLFISATVVGDGNEGRIDGRYLSAIERVSGVARSLPYYETASRMRGRSVVVGGVNLASQCARRVYPFLKGGCGASMEMKGKKGQEETNDTFAIVSEGAARKLSISVGDTLPIENTTFVVAGVFQEFGTEEPLIVVDASKFLQFYAGHNPKTVTIDVENRFDVEVVRRSIEAIAPEDLVVRDHDELRTLVQTLFNRTFRITDSVRWIVFAMAIIGLISTSIQYLWERRREFKTAIVLGASRWVLAFSIAIESGAVAVVALCVGVISGVVIGWCLTEYINPLVFGWSLVFSLTTSPCVEGMVFCGLVTVGTGLISLRMLRVIQNGVRLADE